MDLKHLLTRLAPVRALVVDDEVLLRDLFLRAMQVWGIEGDAVATCAEAQEYLDRHEYRVVLLDIHMADEDGSALLPHVRSRQPNAAVMMISGDQDIRTAIRCLTGGAFDFLLKPIDLAVLRAKIASGLEYMALKQERSRYLEQMEEMAAAERLRSHQTFMSAIDALIRALEAKDHYTKGHSARVAIIAEGMATALSLPSHEIDEIVTAARCHDIGKIGAADHVLQKKGPLTSSEFDHIRSHPTIGARIVAPIFAERPDITLAVRHHHERCDGQGYPDRLAGEDIPLGARIIAVADAFDAMTSDRVYRAARSEQVAINSIVEGSGGQFCPRAVCAFVRFMSRLPGVLAPPPEAWTHADPEQDLDRDAERRLEWRIERVIPATVVTSTRAQRLPILNLSMEGAFIQTREPLREGETLRLSFPLPGREDQGEIELEARVVRVVTLKRATRAPDLMPGMGVEFSAFGGDSRARLQAMMTSRIQHLIRPIQADAEEDDLAQPAAISSKSRGISEANGA